MLLLAFAFLECPLGDFLVGSTSVDVWSDEVDRSVFDGVRPVNNLDSKEAMTVRNARMKVLLSDLGSDVTNKVDVINVLSSETSTRIRFSCWGPSVLWQGPCEKGRIGKQDN